MTKIMLVEDDNNLREIYQARLEAEGYEIVSAPDGEAALAIASKERPDLVISDVMMPKISGFEMLDILRNTEALKNVKIIMLTALGQAEDSERANHLGADKYLVKSQVTLEDIVKAAHELLDPSPEQPPAGINAASEPGDSDVPAPDTAGASSETPPGQPSAPGDSPAEAETPMERPAEVTVPEEGPAAASSPTIAPMSLAEPPAESAPEENLAQSQTIELQSEPAEPRPEPEAAAPAPQPAATEESSISDKIENFISTQDGTLPSAANPASVEPTPPSTGNSGEEPSVALPGAGSMVLPSAPKPAEEKPENPVEALSQQAEQPSAPGMNTAVPVPPTSTVSDTPVDEPAPEEIGVYAPPKITTASNDTTSNATSEDQALANALDGLSSAVPSPQPDTTAQTANPPSTPDAAPTLPASPQPGTTVAPQEDAMHKKKVIAPLNSMTNKPDINQLLALEEAKNSAKQAAQTTNPGTPAPTAQPPAQNAVDPNSISL